MKKAKIFYRRSLLAFLSLIIFAIYIFTYLYKEQVINYDYNFGKVMANMMQVSTIKAERGNIYDRNMQLLATNITTYRVFISPADIEKEEDRENICKNLSDILDVSYEEIMTRALKTNRKDETIKKNVSEEDATAIREFIAKYDYTRMIHLEATSKRYYPKGSLASQVIGYMGTDSGLFGLELQYNSMMTGTDGKYISAKDGKSQDMLVKYETRIEPKNGYSLISTIDVNIQAILENYLQQTYEENAPGNGACGIVMDVDTGAVLGMATVGGCDLNSPFTLTENYEALLAACPYDPESEEYNEYKWELIYNMWQNKCVTDTYEPGSTFKIVTSAIGLETGVVTKDTVMSCSGSYTVAGVAIRCHKHGGHGTGTFSYLLQQSCNPCMMQIAEKIGTKTFREYFESFGYTSKTGVDLPGEASGIYHAFENFHSVELATSSFGQTFRTTPIQQITAICTVANGGYVVTPHLVSAVLDDNGNVIESYDNTTKRQIISEQVCETLSEILAEGVLNGVARNAYVAGYSVAAKTGTSEKRDSEDDTLRVGSTVAFAPSNDPKIAVLIIVDEPSGAVKSGGTVAAPYVARVIEESLEYLGIGRVYTDAEVGALSYQMPDLTGKTGDLAKADLEKAGLKVKVIGEGTEVYSQIPAAGEEIRLKDGTVYLYCYDPATGEIPTPNFETVKVPDVTGYKVSAAITTLTKAGFNVRITGSINYEAGSGAEVVTQSIEKGAEVARGTVIVIESMHTDVNDNN